MTSCSTTPLNLSTLLTHHNRTTTTTTTTKLSTIPSTSLSHLAPLRLHCSVALKQDASTSSSSSSSSSLSEEEESKIGARVRVSVPLKVYHVPKVPEVDLTGMEGKIKQFVGLWKGKRISANLPYKVEFHKEIQGRGNVKFFAHLNEHEFHLIQD